MPSNQPPALNKAVCNVLNGMLMNEKLHECSECNKKPVKKFSFYFIRSISVVTAVSFGCNDANNEIRFMGSLQSCMCFQWKMMGEAEPENDWWMVGHSPQMS